MLTVIYVNKFWWTDDFKEKNVEKDGQAFLYGQKPTSLPISSHSDESEQDDEKDGIENSRFNPSKSSQASDSEASKEASIEPNSKRKKLEKVADADWIR